MSVIRLVESRAKKIDDPIDRLRYLRRAMDTEITDRPGPGRWRPRRWHAAVTGLLLACMIISAYTIARREIPSIPPLRQFGSAGAQIFANVWLVDRTAEFETYSNGLRIENRYSIANQPRGSYPVYARRHVQSSAIEWRTRPSGIVFHTTESLLAPFEPESNGRLQRLGASLLRQTRQNHSYHFVIDRFGRVFRVVQESDLANHAGLSIWGDERYAYVNLNKSFLSIAFETQTEQRNELPSANAAQIHSARVLTQMLRGKYRIPASNCVTHAQVSVNPSNMLVGYHTDWASNFPFSELGLNDNYAEPPASIDTFGFSYDSTFVNATGSRFWQGLILAEEQVRIQAVSQGLSVVEYRKLLQHNYREILATLKAGGAVKENNDET